MLKYLLSGIVALLLFSGCASKPEPEPVIVEVEKPKPVYVAPRRGKVPPLPKREEDIDVDAAVDNAMADL